VSTNDIHTGTGFDSPQTVITVHCLFAFHPSYICTKTFVTRTMSVVGRVEGMGRHSWHMAGLKGNSKIECFQLHLNELTDGELQILF